MGTTSEAIDSPDPYYQRKFFLKVTCTYVSLEVASPYFRFFKMHFNSKGLKYYATGNFYDKFTYYFQGGLQELAGIRRILPPVRRCETPFWKRLLKEEYPSLEEIANRLGFDPLLVKRCKLAQNDFRWRQIYVIVIYFVLCFVFLFPFSWATLGLVPRCE